jgi:hypothetical protein
MLNSIKEITKANYSDKKVLEKHSSLFTLSDMEIFIFPELYYPLVLANIMSPIIWEWRKDSWFKDIEKKSFNYKINRVKQFIMDNYDFNLDLETWGMTTKEREINRFKDFFDISILRQSNALFGYEGDKYYFDIDIRKHFGLDKYNSDTIPYWKTETVEAMTAFKHKPGFTKGAGECVSLSALYAAAMFIIAKIPLEKIFLIATPLHSQNFLDINEGVLTNNRRIVTKNMWYNGTVLSAKARRAIENEVITIVSHISGYIHTVFYDATINRGAYDNFSNSLCNYLKTELTFSIFINFLRHDAEYRKIFQYMHVIDGINYFIPLEKIFEYENTSKFSFSEVSTAQLMSEIKAEDFDPVRSDDLIVLNCIEGFLSKNKNTNFDSLKDYFFSHYKKFNCGHIKEEYVEIMGKLFEKLEKFINLSPRLPLCDKNFVKEEILNIGIEHSREEILEYIFEKAQTNEVAKNALYTYRQMDKIDWRPFFKAAFERNPVCLENLENMTVDEVYKILNLMPNHSIYDGKRLAQPDEVWNFKCGDGIEKAILMANYLINKKVAGNLKLIVSSNKVVLENEINQYHFTSDKNLNKEIMLANTEEEIKNLVN